MSVIIPSSGPVTKKLCEQAHQLFNQTQYQRLAGIAVAHLYSLENPSPISGKATLLKNPAPKSLLLAIEKRAFNHDTLFLYIDYHRPCFFPKTITDSQGKDKKIYPYGCMMMPYDKLKSIESDG